MKHNTRGEQIPCARSQATNSSTVASNVFGSSMELATCGPSSSSNFGAVPTFLENLCTPALGQQLGIGTTVGVQKCIDERLTPVLNVRPRH